MDIIRSLKQTACSAIDKESKTLLHLGQQIWSNPEECHAHDVLTEFLQQRGFKVQKHYKLNNAFKADLGSGDNGPNIALICEYDVLPEENSNVCGHNLIAEAGMATAIGIQAAFQELVKPIGKLTVLGTPKEKEGSKVDMIKSGVFDEIDVALMVHPAQDIEPYISMMGADWVTVKYSGKAAHASAYPWNGVNALDAAVLCYQTISCMRQQLKPSWRVHGIIKHGGTRPNIIPEYAELEYSFRAPSNSELFEIRVKLASCFESAAVGTGCKVAYRFSEKPYLNLKTNKRLTDVFKDNAMALGVEFVRPVNDPFVSTDLGHVSNIVPSIHPFLALGSEAANYKQQFNEPSDDPSALSYTLTQGKVLAMTCIDVFSNEDLLDEIHDEFNDSSETSL